MPDVPALEVTCAVILALYVAVRARRSPGPAVLARRLGLLAAAAFVGEDTVIRAYGFYAYSPTWSLFLDRVPLLVTLIWPVVIHSAWDLARHLLGRGHRLVPLLGAAFVLADAWLIEPVAVQAGLWSWTEPGLLGVPPIGVMGWAFFAAACIALLERGAAAEARAARLAPEVAAVALAPLATHALLLLTWWGALRWVNVPVAPWPPVATLWAVAAPLTAYAWRRRLRDRMALGDMLARVPAALFFLGLLWLHGRTVPPLVAWTLAFVPPYVALVPWARVRASIA